MKGSSSEYTGEVLASIFSLPNKTPSITLSSDKLQQNSEERVIDFQEESNFPCANSSLASISQDSLQDSTRRQTQESSDFFQENKQIFQSSPEITLRSSINVKSKDDQSGLKPKKIEEYQSYKNIESVFEISSEDCKKNQQNLIGCNFSEQTFSKSNEDPPLINRVDSQQSQESLIKNKDSSSLNSAKNNQLEMISIQNYSFQNAIEALGVNEPSSVLNKQNDQISYQIQKLVEKEDGQHILSNHFDQALEEDNSSYGKKLSEQNSTFNFDIEKQDNQNQDNPFRQIIDQQQQQQEEGFEIENDLLLLDKEVLEQIQEINDQEEKDESESPTLRIPKSRYNFDDSIEERIFRWLDEQGIVQLDPQNKREEFYRKKRENLIEMRSSISSINEFIGSESNISTPETTKLGVLNLCKITSSPLFNRRKLGKEVPLNNIRKKSALFALQREKKIEEEEEETSCQYGDGNTSIIGSGVNKSRFKLQKCNNYKNEMDTQEKQQSFTSLKCDGFNLKKSMSIQLNSSKSIDNEDITNNIQEDEIKKNHIKIQS